MEVVWKVRGQAGAPRAAGRDPALRAVGAQGGARAGLPAFEPFRSFQPFDLNGSAMDSITLDLGDLPDLPDWPDEVIDLDDLPDWPPEMAPQR